MAFNNEIRLQGNLTKDPEYKNISEKDLVTFRLAVNESVGRDKEERTYVGREKDRAYMYRQRETERTCVGGDQEIKAERQSA